MIKDASTSNYENIENLSIKLNTDGTVAFDKQNP